MVSAAHVEPFDIRKLQILSEFIFHNFQSRLQIIRVLLAEGMKMDPVKLFHKIFPEIGQGHAESLGTGGAQAAARRAGVVNFVVLLSGALRVYADADADAFFLTEVRVFFKLGKGIEYQMFADIGEFPDLRFLEGRSEYVIFFSHFFISKLCLEKTAGCGSVQILPDQRVLKEVRECLLGKEDLASGVVLYFL